MMRALAFGGKQFCVTGGSCYGGRQSTECRGSQPAVATASRQVSVGNGRTGMTTLTSIGPGSDDEAAPPVMGISP